MSQETVSLELAAENDVVLPESKESETKKDDFEKQDPDFVNVPLSKLQFVSVFLSLLFGVFLVALDSTIISTAIPAIAKEFHALDLISWIGTGFTLTSTSFSPLYGSFCDIWGRKATFLAAITFFEIGSLICGLAPSIETLIAGRLIAGIGGGGIFACALIIISDIVSLRDRGKYQGIIGAVFGLSSVIGPLVGGFFTDYITWRWSFYINLPFGFLTVVAISVLLKFPAPEGSVREKLHKIDYLGTFLIVCTSAFLLTPLQLGGSKWEWSDAKTISFFVASLVFGAAFVYVETKVARNPLIPPSMFENRSVALILAIAFFLGVSFLSVIFYVPSFFQLVLGDSATTSGLEAVPLVFGLVALSITSGQLISRTGHYKYWFFIGPTILAVGQGLLSTLSASTPKYAQILFLIVPGIGIGCLIQVRILSIQASVSKENIAVATAICNFFFNLGGTVGIAIGGTIFNNTLSEQLPANLAKLAQAGYSVFSQTPFAKQITDAIATSLGRVYYFTIPVTALIFLIGLGVVEYTTEKAKTLPISEL
ncbi:hypothetical protein HDU91_006594 [Kappamyces sp. JEL0680]|nr:hypothetical protein HDU91_006594 [Kappamyces sp. JEL0680]